MKRPVRVSYACARCEKEVWLVVDRGQEELLDRAAESLGWDLDGDAPVCPEHRLIHFRLVDLAKVFERLDEVRRRVRDEDVLGRCACYSLVAGRG